MNEVSEWLDILGHVKRDFAGISRSFDTCWRTGICRTMNIAQIILVRNLKPIWIQTLGSTSFPLSQEQSRTPCVEWHWASFNILKPCSSQLDGSLRDVNPSTQRMPMPLPIARSSDKIIFMPWIPLWWLQCRSQACAEPVNMMSSRPLLKQRGTSSFSELVNPFGLFVHCFVSHFWGHNFTSTVTALDLWADSNYDKVTSEKEALVYWICLFALNQHDVAEEVGENPQQGPFNAALAQASGGAVMVLDEEVKPWSPGGGRSYDLAWLRGN